MTAKIVTDILASAAAFCGNLLAYPAAPRHGRHALPVILNDAVTSMPYGVLYFDRNEKLVWKNKAAESFLALDDIDHPLDTIDSFLDFMFSHRTGDETPSKRTPHDMRHDFREIVAVGDMFLLVQCTMIPAGELLVLLTDITDLKRNEEHIVRLHRQNHELLQATEATANGVFVTNPKKPDNPVVFVNRAYCAMAGLPRERIMNSGLNAVLQAQKDIPDLNRMEREIAQGRGVKQEWSIRDADSHLAYQLALSPVFDAQGKLDLFIGIQTDVTEIKMQEAQFFQAQKLEALGQLAGGVAHDFNNVLSIIDGYVRMAGKLVPEDDEQMKSHLDRIAQASKRGAALTRQLLLFGRHRIAGDAVVDIYRLLHDHEHLLHPLLDSSIEMQIRAEKNLFAECPADGMAQIVMNLVINARDAMPEGGKIMIEACRATPEMLQSVVQKDKLNPGKEYVVLSVADSGIGMDAKTVARIFDPFFTTKEQGKGTGLGLSMVYGIVNDMKGLIDVHATPGEGTTMRVFLPVSEKGIAREVRESTENTAGIRFDGFTALVAEDEPALLELMSSMLEELGMEVITASNGAEALLRQDEYEGDIDLLLTDVVMPELNGVKLAELFQAVREETKVIFMSGFPANGKLARIEIPENAVLLAKPVKFETLAAAAKAVLDDEYDISETDLRVWQEAHG